MSTKAMVPNPDQYVSLSFHTSHQELALKMFGRVIGELSELSGLRGKDVESTKEWLSATTDTARVPYERFPQNFVRRLLFVGTTNRDDFASDDTGNRRLLPVWVGAHQDFEGVARDRGQLWAEAILLFDQGGIQWKEAQELAKAEHKSVMAEDPLEVPLLQWLNQRQTVMGFPPGSPSFRWRDLPYLVLADVAFSMLQIPLSRVVESRIQHDLARGLKKAGYVSKQYRVDGVNTRVWMAPGYDAAKITDWERTHPRLTGATKVVIP
jgi:hypothetical protein